MSDEINKQIERINRDISEEVERRCKQFVADARGQDFADTLEAVLKENIALRAQLESVTRERDKWKWEYENLCKFATDFEQQRDTLRAQLAQATEALERTMSTLTYYWEGPYGPSPSIEDMKFARAALERMGARKGEG
jgi:septal ring factor EnvC (AmiA/AmiB activator)